jgi:hypothetical protein
MAEVAVGPKRRGWLRKLAWAILILLVLLVVLFFIVTSSAFFKGVILPKVGKSINARISVADASISPFSKVILKGVKVETAGTEPLFTAREVRLVYHLWDIVGGNYNVDEAVVDSPNIVIITNPNGTSNLDPITKNKKEEAKAPSKAAKPSKAPQVDVKKVALNNANIRMVKNYNGGARDITELTRVNLTLDNLKNGQTGKMTLAASINLDNRPPAPETNALMQASLVGAFSITPTADFGGATISGNTHMDVQKTAGSFSEFNALAAIIECDISPTDIKQFALRFQKAGANLGELRVSGPFDMAKSEGHLTVQLLSLDRNVLNLVGARSGIDFGSTVINSTNQVDLAKAGSQIALRGGANLAKVQITRTAQTTPSMDIASDYDLTVDTGTKVALIKAMNINGTENQRPFLHGELTAPMNVAWGNVTNAIGDSAFKLGINNLNLADWRPFLGDKLVNGNFTMAANLVSQQAGKQLTFDVNSDITGIEARVGSNNVTKTDVHWQTKGQALDLKQFNLQELELKINHAGQTALSITGAGKFDSGNNVADMQITLNASLPRLLDELSAADRTATSGSLELKGHLLQNNTNITTTGTLTLADFTGRIGSNQFNNFGSVVDLDVGITNNTLNIRKAAGTVTQGQAPGGRFDVSGNYDLGKQAGQFALKLIDFNENALRPFLGSALGEKHLESISVNATSSARYDAQGESSVKGDFQLANLIVTDPKQPATKPSPLEAKFQIDAGLKNKVADVRQFQLNLTPTERAKNELTLSGQVDMSQTNATQGNFKLTSQSLDITHYYDLFTADKEKAKAAKTSNTPAGTVSATPPDANKEPDPINLPLRNSSMEVNIARFYLREVEITNLLTTAKIDGGHVLLKPFQLVLNGAPVNATADLNLGVPGFQYDVNFSADRIPVAPLANSFSPEYKGRAQGELIATGQIKGAGVTGVSLQKNLTGQVNLSFTNANIQIVGTRAKKLINPIAVVLRLDDLTKSPINYLLANAKMGEGNINITQFRVVSSAFTASSQGVIPIANVLTNSPINNWPVELSLKRSLAQKSNLLPANSPTNADYVALPTFVTVAGTIGDPNPRINKLVITGILAQSAAGLPGGVGKEAGKVLKGIGGLNGILGGSAGSNTNQPSPGTNQTNKPSHGNLFDLIPRVLPK